MFVARPRYAALRARYQQIIEERDDAVKLAADRLCTIVRLCTEIDQLRDKSPDTPLPQPRPPVGDAETRRQLHLARRALASMDGQLSMLQTANESQARELQDLRVNGAAS